MVFGNRKVGGREKRKETQLQSMLYKKDFHTKDAFCLLFFCPPYFPF